MLCLIRFQLDQYRFSIIVSTLLRLVTEKALETLTLSLLSKYTKKKDRRRIKCPEKTAQIQLLFLSFHYSTKNVLL